MRAAALLLAAGCRSAIAPYEPEATRDQFQTRVEPDLDEYEYHCSEVGLLLVEKEGVRVELIEYSGP